MTAQSSFTTPHPLYSDARPDWDLMRDCFRGERRIKDKGRVYLPATEGMVLDGLHTGGLGLKNYEAYKLRARFPDFVAQAVEGMIGIMHHKPPTIDLPDRMEPLRESATVRGESLNMLLRRINTEQLVTGRLGLFADVPMGGGPNVLPYIALYNAQTIVNWDDGARDRLVLQELNLVVLDESEFEREDRFDWEFQTKHRVLVLGDLRANEMAGPYRMGVFREEDNIFNEDELIQPSIAGRTLDKIPFVFINSRDIVTDPDCPPLLGLGRLALTVYRGEADYRQHLFLQAQDTLVIRGGTIERSETGDNGDLRTGTGSVITVPPEGDAKYIGVTGTGLPEQRTALENDRKEAAEIGGKLLDTRRSGDEPADALRIRVSARTASLNQIALAGAEGLQTVLRMMAEWLGEDPEQVVVQPNQDFADDPIDGDMLSKVVAAKTAGLPISKRSLHTWMQEKDLTKLTFEEEMQEIEQETPEEEPGDVEGQPGTGAVEGDNGE